MEQGTPRSRCSFDFRFVLALAALHSLSPSARLLAEQGTPEIKTQHVDEAGPDFHVQGEYIGSLKVAADAELFGLQVIARGEGKFDARGYRGGLPGAGWDGSEKWVYQGKTDGKRTILDGDNTGDYPQIVLRNGRARIRNAANKVVGRLERVTRKSSTLGAKAPEGAVILFDGKTDALTHHKGDKPLNVTPEGFLQLLGGSSGIRTRETFGACKLHIEFRLPFEPKLKGQNRGNSGCYLQGRYEVQILDSFGLEGKENECGGVYSSGRDPKVNMCFPPLSWQTYDIEFTPASFDGDGKKTAGARLTVLHNGVEVYRDLDLAHREYTTAAINKVESDGPKGHYLQDHSHELWYRNMWAVKR